MGGRESTGVIAAAAGLVLAMGACAKPLAPVTSTPQTTPAPIAADEDEDDSRSYQMPRDPKGGYATEDRPPPREPAPPVDSPPHDPGDPLADDPRPPPPKPDEPRCTRKQFVVERCITGGAPRRGPDGRLHGRTSCHTRCEATPPTEHPSRRCRKIDDRHYQCKSFAP